MSEADRLVELCRERLEHFSQGNPPRALPIVFDQALIELVAILQANHQPRGKTPSRFEHWRKRRGYTPDCTESNYVDQVIACWNEHRGRVHRLAADDPAEWQQLHLQMWKRAQRMLSGCGPDLAARDADDFAQQACEQIRRKPFPFDTSFDAWANTILKNIVLKEIQRLNKPGGKTRSLDEPIGVSGDEAASSLGDQAADERTATRFSQVEDQTILVPAIKQLLPKYQEVIVMKYWEGLKDEEVAQELGIKVANARVLKHRALKALHKILEGTLDRGRTSTERSSGFHSPGEEQEHDVGG